MLGISKDRVPFKVSLDVGMQDVLHYLGANGGQRYWSVVGSLGLVTFLEDWDNVCHLPVI
jgi:hypothetical protein